MNEITNVFECDNCGRKSTAAEVESLNATCPKCHDVIKAYTTEAARAIIFLQSELDKRKGGGDKRECLDCEHQTVPLHEEPCCLCTRTSYHAYWKAKSHAPVAEAGELITEAEYLAKTKGECDVLIEKIMDAVPPANPKPVTFAIEGIPATAGECAAFIQGVQLGKEAAKPEQVESERALESDLQALIDLHISLNNRMNHLKKYINELKTQRAINELKKERAG
jgi:hypothetical protein